MIEDLFLTRARMARIFTALVLALSFASFCGNACAQSNGVGTAFPLVVEQLEVHTAKLDAVEVTSTAPELVNYGGRSAIRLVNKAGHTAAGEPANGETIAILKGSGFKDGTIEAEVLAVPRPRAQANVRGFVGIAFRVAPHGSQYECFSIRQQNGRADDQLRRNHTTQYSSYPDFPWHRLRDESPGVYESYADVKEDNWTKIKITVSGDRARLYVGGAEQPVLIVNGLKLGDSRGQIALWVGTDSEGYFSNLVVR